uniref:Uncharacterized protein n=1 Tax=Rhizophora mucronata TaxID=61149 RepID=A0A2P2JCG1_RHIMU
MMMVELLIQRFQLLFIPCYCFINSFCYQPMCIGSYLNTRRNFLAIALPSLEIGI